MEKIKEDKFLLKALWLVSFSKRESDDLVTMFRKELTKIKEYTHLDRWMRGWIYSAEKIPL